MFMFQSGLLATFIPELFMVIGFVLCILTPGFQSHYSNTEQSQLTIQVTGYEPQQIASYQLTYSDFHVDAQTEVDNNQALPYFIVKDTYIAFNSSFSTSDGLSFVDFSRPPPAIVS